eukprot:TRINITY_DN6952_c0_g1_i4.p1 TRINITY_DN6952_c0_g1~~TRINITY_DN6952_c0_g1_i4.p1  ORF type:complete len:886 (+),score=206.35 TRINITY_DN6952_c0_g1_i4:127-2784(+)
MAGFKDIPGCTCCLFIGALTCHILVLVGNLSTATMLKNVGASAGGWSTVGSKVTHALNNELNPAMNEVTTLLTNSIDAVTAIETGVDTLLSAAGSSTDAALAKFDAEKHDVEQFKEQALQGIEKLAKKFLAKVNEVVVEFMDIITPALRQIGAWLESFSEKIQDILEEFGTVIDRAQKIFDQAMAQLSPASGSVQATRDMIYDTFNIFDADHTGAVTLQNIQEVAGLYSITALLGDKAAELLEKYDVSNTGDLSIDEYARFAQDPSLPGLMTTVLRQYSSKLAVIGGRLEQGKLRAEIAEAVVDYIKLVSSKNLTKVEWVTSYLTSGKIIHKFVADVLYEFVQAIDSPDSPTLINVGSLFINYTMRQDAEFVIAALDLMSNTSFFESEGFETSLQADTAAQVVEWILHSPNGRENLQKYSKIQPRQGESYIEAYKRVVKARGAKFLAAEAAASGTAGLDLYSSAAAQNLQNILLGGVSAVAAGTDPNAAVVQGSGVPAVPSTLALAAELAYNVSMTVNDYNNKCFAYSGTSSNALDSVANNVNGMIKKTQAFLSLMEKYAGPNGTEILTLQAEQFVAKTLHDILAVTKSYVDTAIDTAACEAGNEKSCDSSNKAAKDMPVELQGGLTFLTSTLEGLKMCLPTVITNLGTAKEEVQSISALIDSIMSILGQKAPPLFDEISSLYKTIWVLYFAFFATFTATMLFYAFWANGFFGGPSPSAEEESYEPPQTFMERMRTCCNSCLACCSGCLSGHLCFWSFLLLSQVLVLVLFVISLVVCLLTGVQAFVGAGCSMIYLIGDESVCTTSLGIFQSFLKTFEFGIPMGAVCNQQQLLTCGIIRDEVYSSAIYVMIGALLASVFSFQMLLDSAVKHERARCTRILEKEKGS